MAICPECHSQKPFWAPRCHACNEDIGFLRQTLAQIVFYGTQIVILYVLWLIFFS